MRSKNNTFGLNKSNYIIQCSLENKCFMIFDLLKYLGMFFTVNPGGFFIASYLNDRYELLTFF